MKTQKDLIEHVASATGIARPEVRKVIDAAFGYVRQSALAGGGVRHPSLGVIRARTRAGKDGEDKTVYRFNPKGGGKGKRRGRKTGKPDTGGEGGAL